MTIDANTIIVVYILYVVALFILAWRVDIITSRGGGAWLRSPLTYTLSLSVYCTAWTYFGAVGSAARNGLEFATIYLGPTVVFLGWWWLLRKIVRIGRMHRITSIADMISSRYGKSGGLAAFATIVAVMAGTPYISLQLESLTLSYQGITGVTPGEDGMVTFLAAFGLGIFTILFATRSLDEYERHYGVVAAIAVEAVIKLVALMAVGIFAIWSVCNGLDHTFEYTTAETLRISESFGTRWMVLMFLSATAIICLPRQFQVMVVENTDERRLAAASWMFPTYLLLISLFVLPIAAVGLQTMPAGANPDLYVLTLPMSQNAGALAILAYIGGLSASTSMVVISTIALSTMVSNHIIAPLSVRLLTIRKTERSGDVRRMLLVTRRIAILGIIALGYVNFRLASREDSLAANGLIAFCGVAQFLPPLIAGLFWRGATKAGAATGLSIGFVTWLWTLYLPSFHGDIALPASVMEHGPFGVEFLRPHAIFGTEADDPLVFATIWSVGLNTLALMIVSLFSKMSPMERLQSALFVNVFRSEPVRALALVRRSAAASDLFILAQRILGANAATIVFDSARARQGKTTGLPDPTPAFIAGLERLLAGSVGAASAHAMVNRIAGETRISMPELSELADENAKLRRATEALRAKSAEVEKTARELRAANEQLRTIDAQKDEFLSHISHELRTPMTSVRSFAEILEQNPDIDPDQRRRFASIIQSESMRLTRLLDEIRDLSFLDDPNPTDRRALDAEEELKAAVEIALAPFADRNVGMTLNLRAGVAIINADPDRLKQVFINLITNSIIHNDKPNPEIEIRTAIMGDHYQVEIRDNGPGISRDDRLRVFETFFRRSTAGSAGLGLPICRKFMTLFGGSIELGPEREEGVSFILLAPLATKESCQPDAASALNSVMKPPSD